MSSDHLKALYHARDGRWDEAHRLVQDHSDQLACLIHAHLHREEGDMGNARYWYSRAGAEMPNASLAEELDDLLKQAGQ